MDRRQRLAELLVAWQAHAGRGEVVTPRELCQNELDLLPDLERLIRLDAARAEAPTAMTDAVDTSATDVAVPVPAGPGEPVGWLAPAQAVGEFGRLGKYRVRRVVRAGGMGIVLEAEDPTLKRPVAIKVMHPRLAADPRSRARFVREAEAMARLDHEHVVPVYEAAEDPTARVAYLVMPFLKGEPLDVRLARETQLPPAVAIRIAREAAEGLQAAHERGLIHRDVKPSNIWLDRRGRVKLLDFGLAHVGDGDADLSQEGRVVGTPAYMSPEQAGGQPVDARADLFSLGCVLFRMTTGKAPFAGASSVATFYSIATAPVPDPRAINPALSVGLSALIRRLLARDPADRPASAGAVARELADLEDAEADTLVPEAMALPEITPSDPWSQIHPAEPAEPSKPSSRSRRHPPWRTALVLAAAAAVLVLAAVTVVLVMRPTRGTVAVEPADPAADGRLRISRIHLADDDGRMFTLEPGERSRPVPPGTYRVMIVGADRLDPNPARVVVRRGETSVVRIIVTPPMVVPVPPKKTTPADPVRAAASWVSENGGTLLLAMPGAKDLEIGPKGALPARPFTVRRVHLSRSADVAGQLHRLAALKDLQTLELIDCRIGDADLAEIGALSALRALTVSVAEERGRVTDAGLVHLDGLSRLEQLILTGQPVSDAGLVHLSDLTALKVVGFSGTRITGTGLAHLARNTGLQEVHGLGVPTDEGVALLARFSNLTNIDLGHALNVTDAGLKPLVALGRLEFLNIHNSRLTDEGLKSLSGLKELRNLGADGTALTDAGLVHVKAFPKLESLGVGATGITDAGLKILGERKNLRWLNVRQTKTTAAGRKVLQQALPDCEIHSDDGIVRPANSKP